MKALTLTQPWATLVALGEKRIETRSWSTKYRGEIAIHAGIRFPFDCRDLCDTPPFRSVLRGFWLGASDLPAGRVIATALLVECIETEVATAGIVGENLVLNRYAKPRHYRIGRHERDFGDYTPGRWAWVLDDIKPLPEPIPARGARRLWEWTP
jgi:hypothetical protein